MKISSLAESMASATLAIYSPPSMNLQFYKKITQSPFFITLKACLEKITIIRKYVIYGSKIQYERGDILVSLALGAKQL